MSHRYVPTLEIGGSHVSSALVDLEAGRLVNGTQTRLPLEPNGPAEHIVTAIARCGHALPHVPRAPWGIAIPGPFDYERGVGRFSGVGKFESLNGMDLRAALAARLPGTSPWLSFVNDAQAFLWGEWRFGAAREHSPCVGITLGTGIGSAFLSEGRLRCEGPGVPPEGRVDLLSVGGRPLEDVVSTRAIERAYLRRTGELVRGAADIAARARRGEEEAVSVLADAFGALSRALRPHLVDFGARALVIGGSMSLSWDVIGPVLLAGLSPGGNETADALLVSLASNPHEAGLLGAADIAATAFDLGGRRSQGSSAGDVP